MPTPRPPSRANSFAFLRMALALVVIVGHSFSLGGFGTDPFYRWCGGDLAIHEVPLQGFFILSGFLLTRSLSLQPSLTRFALRRSLRILPGYWMALLVTSLAIVPAAVAYLYPGDFSFGESLVAGDLNAASYLARNALLWSGQTAIPGLFFQNPITGIVNGSLWSIFFETLCYAALGLAAAGGALRRRNLVLGVCAMLYLPCVIHAFLPMPVPSPQAAWARVCLILFHPAGPHLALPFASGVAAYFLAQSRPIWNTRVFCLALAFFIPAMPLGGARVFCPLALPYLLLCLAEKLPFQNWDRFGDFSYGIYLYAFVIQQCLVMLGVHHHGFGIFLASSMALSAMAGALSWFLIERPAIRIGGRLLTRMTARSRVPGPFPARTAVIPAAAGGA